MKCISILLVFSILTGFISCNVINPKEDIPTYIQIDSVRVVPTNAVKHGSVNHKITDVWVYYDRDIIGPFELPARVPIIADGKKQLQILAGIYDNGLSITRVKYPFYTVDTFTFDASPTNTIKHIPIFNYRVTDTPAVSYIIESFEQGNIFTKRYSNDTTIVRSNNPAHVFEGDWSGIIAFKDSIDNAECITAQNFNLPVGRDCYMELNYKCDVPFIVSTEALYKGSYVNTDIIGLRANNKWSKVYLNLTGLASTFQGAAFKFVFKAEKPSNISEANILIDNFKIVYFN